MRASNPANGLHSRWRRDGGPSRHDDGSPLSSGGRPASDGTATTGRAHCHESRAPLPCAPVAGGACLMPTLSRADNSVLGRWWWTVDRWTLVCIGTLIGFGYLCWFCIEPGGGASHWRSPRDMLIIKQVLFLGLAGAIVVGVSLLSPKGIRWLALTGTLVALLLTAFTLVHRRRDQGCPAVDITFRSFRFSPVSFSSRSLRC